jgi:hypothetical protein
MCSREFRQLITPLVHLVPLLKNRDTLSARAEIGHAFDGPLRAILRPKWKQEWAETKRIFWSHFPPALARRREELELLSALLNALWGFHEESTAGNREKAFNAVGRCVTELGHSVDELLMNEAVKQTEKATTRRKKAGPGRRRIDDAAEKRIWNACQSSENRRGNKIDHKAVEQATGHPLKLVTQVIKRMQMRKARRRKRTLATKHLGNN